MPKFLRKCGGTTLALQILPAQQSRKAFARINSKFVASFQHRQMTAIFGPANQLTSQRCGAA